MQMRIFHMCSVLDSKDIFRMYWSLKISTKKHVKKFLRYRRSQKPQHSTSHQHHHKPRILIARKNPSDGTNSSRLSWPSWAGAGRFGGKDAQLFGDEGSLPTDTGPPRCNKGFFHGIHVIPDGIFT